MQNEDAVIVTHTSSLAVLDIFFLIIPNNRFFSLAICNQERVYDCCIHQLAVKVVKQQDCNVGVA